MAVNCPFRTVCSYDVFKKAAHNILYRKDTSDGIFTIY